MLAVTAADVALRSNTQSATAVHKQTMAAYEPANLMHLQQDLMAEAHQQTIAMHEKAKAQLADTAETLATARGLPVETQA